MSSIALSTAGRFPVRRKRPNRPALDNASRLVASVVRGPVQTLLARFNHDTTREIDPQLYTHAVVINATRQVDREWRALSSKENFPAKMLGGDLSGGTCARGRGGSPDLASDGLRVGHLDATARNRACAQPWPPLFGEEPATAHQEMRQGSLHSGFRVVESAVAGPALSGRVPQSQWRVRTVSSARSRQFC